MSTSTVENFRGCSPSLFRVVSPSGVARQNFKYYLLEGGPNAGVYLDQRVASGRARDSKQREPKGYNTEQALIDDWMFLCNEVHKHSPQELRPFVDPFLTGQEHQEPREAVRPLPQQPPATPDRREKAMFGNTDMITDLIGRLSTEAAPFPHDPVASPSRQSSPTRKNNSPAKQRRKTPSSSAQSPGPSKIRKAVVEEVGSGYPSSESDGAKEKVQFFAIKFEGGFDFYSSSSEAVSSFQSLQSKGLNPRMRFTNDFDLVQDFLKGELEL
ncbi:hypothetical protein K435DRAFT_880304 [Dendrothele bispora CBS 962.96]|uniref:Uncharacterized protein n=1 Tax=Dendrothele bispora (strain CBS 962.96) TaxID=1314807 RepID=A0A4S8KJS7_DENBC|nr:hypothetical protein K435DRAFT_880304 [Dendrothele bispora CBS 962.96]